MNELTKQSLDALNSMRIKFPGKSNKEAAELLDLVSIQLLCDTLLCSTLLYSTLLCSTLPYSTLLYSTLLYSTLLYSTLLYSTLLCSALLYSTLLYCCYHFIISLSQIMENWKYHKPKVASYWLVKLDSTKRRKVGKARFYDFRTLSSYHTMTL